MTIEQTVEIPANHRLHLELPRTVPTGVMATVEINIPTVVDAFQNSPQPGTPVKSFRGILKGRGITLERFREMQREDKALEDEADERRNKGTQGF
jgi:hypothetical protein